jgi:hypothetical protein
VLDFLEPLEYNGSIPYKLESFMGVQDVISELNVEPCCVVCGSRSKLTVDHIYPKSVGGANHIANYQIMCYTHNQNKCNYIDYSVKTFDVYYANTFFAAIHKTNLFNINYRKTILRNCFGVDQLDNNSWILKSELPAILDFLKLYGIEMDLDLPVETITRPEYIMKYNPNYRVSLHRTKELVEQIYLTKCRGV